MCGCTECIGAQDETLGRRVGAAEQGGAPCHRCASQVGCAGLVQGSIVAPLLLCLMDFLQRSNLLRIFSVFLFFNKIRI
jgi:hypothetical protein